MKLEEGIKNLRDGYSWLDESVVCNLSVVLGLASGLGSIATHSSRVDAMQVAIKNEKHKYKIDHENDSDVFFEAYFAKNFFKCLVSLIISKVEVGRYKSISDVGCGPGSFSIAYAVLCGRGDSRVRLLDRSISQIKKSLMLHELLDFFPNVTAEHGQFSDRLSGECDLNLCSYVFCENIDMDGFDIRERIGSITKKESIIVDYDYIIEFICKNLPDGVELESAWTGSVPVPPAIGNWLGERSINVSGARLIRR